MEWLLAHSDELDSGNSSSNQAAATPASQSEDKTNTEEAPTEEAKSIKCEE